jgi:anti-sigma regulatory factor (Ser/Thr protein kinase)
MSKFKKTFRIKGRNFIHAGEASINIQNLLKSMDFDLRLVRRIAICGYEGEMNMVMHGGDGSLSLEIDADRLILELTDDGPGIEDEDAHREMGFGAGMGLPNMKKNADRIHIESKRSQGTIVQMIFFLPDGDNAD